MITTNKDLRIDTFHNSDVAYLANSPDRYEVSRQVTIFLCGLKLNPISVSKYLGRKGCVSLDVRKKLLKNNFVTFAHCQPDGVASKLRQQNWPLAEDYLRRTYDYPFFNYEKDGWTKDAKMMTDYLAVEQESSRNRKIESLDYEIYPRSCIEALECFKACHEYSSLDLVCSAIVATFGVKKAAKISGSTPIYKKTVPSGGGRHPSECYLIDMRNLGAYHYCSGMNSFGRLKKNSPKMTSSGVLVSLTPT